MPGRQQPALPSRPGGWLAAPSLGAGGRARPSGLCDSVVGGGGDAVQLSEMRSREHINLSRPSITYQLQRCLDALGRCAGEE